LLGFIGPVPPPARDKRVSVQGHIIHEKALHCQQHSNGNHLFMFESVLM